MINWLEETSNGCLREPPKDENSAKRFIKYLYQTLQVPLSHIPRLLNSIVHSNTVRLLLKELHCPMRAKGGTNNLTSKRRDADRIVFIQTEGPWEFKDDLIITREDMKVVSAIRTHFYARQINEDFILYQDRHEPIRGYKGDYVLKDFFGVYRTATKEEFKRDYRDVNGGTRGKY